MNLGIIPTPPAAYWAQVPWWAFLFFVLIGFIAVPFITQVMRGRAGIAATREAALNAGMERLDRERIQHERTLMEDSKACREQLARERAQWLAERAVLIADRDDGWNAGRGMEDVAHWHRHQHAGTAQRFNALLAMFTQLAASEMAPERAAALLAQIKPADAPPPVPLLRDVRRKTPEEYGRLP